VIFVWGKESVQETGIKIATITVWRVTRGLLTVSDGDHHRCQREHVEINGRNESVAK
jgi:hypothetical protein